MVVAVLFGAGDQVPLIPLFESTGSAFKTVPEQIGATVVNVGVTLGLTVMTIVLVVAHCPEVGVNV